MAVKAKQLIKWKKRTRALNLLAKCREHGGPLSKDNFELLDSLTYEQIVTETSYIKATLADELRLKRRVKDEASGKFKFVNLPIETLKTGLQSVLCPAKSSSHSVDDLLSQIFLTL